MNALDRDIAKAAKLNRPDDFKFNGHGDLGPYCIEDEFIPTETACQLDFRGNDFKIAVGIPCEYEREDVGDRHVWGHAKFRWVFLQFLSGYDGDPTSLRRAARRLREYADMADFVAAENDAGRRPALEAI